MAGYRRKRVHRATLVLEGSLMVESLEWTMFKHPARQEFWTLEVRAGRGGAVLLQNLTGE
jgi:hypothetical protein